MANILAARLQANLEHVGVDADRLFPGGNVGAQQSGVLECAGTLGYTSPGAEFLRRFILVC